MKLKHCFHIGILLSLAIIAPVLASTNSTSFITINSIGNYTIGNVLYINGTTNLPVNTTLSVSIYPDYYNPGYRGPPLPMYLLTNISIVSTPSGINLWSVNATGIDFNELSFKWSLYQVAVQNSDDSAFADRDMTVLLAPIPNSTPFITMDHVDNYTMGDVFFINGTTNLPVTETLRVTITTMTYYLAEKNSPPVNYPGVVLPDVPIVSTPSGANRWSVNVTDLVISNLNAQPQWEPYGVYVFSNNESLFISAAQEFYILPATNTSPVTVSQTTIQNPSPTSTQLSSLTALVGIGVAFLITMAMKKGK